MQRPIWIAVAIALLVAIWYGWSAIRERELRGLVDAEPVVHIEAESWRIFYDRVVDSPSFRSLRESEAVEEVLDSPAGRDFMDIRNGLEVVLDEDPAELFLRTFGRRLEGGIWIRPTGGLAVGLVSLPEDDTDLADVAARIDVMAKSSPQEPSQQIEGMTVFPLGRQGVMVFSDEVAVLASHQTLGLALARSWPGRLRAQNDIAPGIHVQFGPEVRREPFADPGIEDPWGTLGSQLLFGELRRVIEESANTALDVVPVDGGLRVDVRFEAGLATLYPEGGRPMRSLPPETPLDDDEILRGEFARDLPRFWADRERYLSEPVLRRLLADEAEAGLSGLTEAALNGIEPPLVLEARNVQADAGRDRIPALGMVLHLNDPSLAPRLEQLFETGLAAVSAQDPEGARIHLSPAPVGEEPGLRPIRVDWPELEAPDDGLREWLDPVLGRGSSRLALASQPALAIALLERSPGSRSAAGGPSDRIRIRAEPLRAAIEANFEMLVERGMRDRFVDRSQVERELRGVMGILAGLSDLRLEWVQAEQETVASLVLRGR